VPDNAETPFSFQPSGHFSKRLENIRRNDPSGYVHIVKVVERLLSEPEDTDGMLSGPHRGKLKKYVGRSGYRIVYNWCAACKKSAVKMHENCESCGTIPDNSVVFLDIFHKSEAHRLTY